MEKGKVNRVLIPYLGRKLPKKAQKKALDRLEKGGEIFLLHILDEAPTRSIRYRTGQMGEKSEIIKTFKETQEKVQESAAKDYAEDVKKVAAKKGISVKPFYASGSPAEEILKAVEKYSIELVIIEKLREKMPEILLGDEIEYLCDKVACEVLTVSD